MRMPPALGPLAPPEKGVPFLRFLPAADLVIGGRARRGGLVEVHEADGPQDVPLRAADKHTPTSAVVGELPLAHHCDGGLHDGIILVDVDRMAPRLRSATSRWMVPLT